MVKFRSAKYCNLKLFLLYLVVYGHWIEAGIWDSEALRIQYRLIYLVHMPLFAFLTGLFVRSGEDCLRQLKRLLPMYLLLQSAAVAFSGGSVQPLTPFWHLWYLLSCCFWMGLAWLWFRFGRGRGKGLILAASVILGCFAGYLPWLDRTLSGSRTVVFFPCFWLGMLCRQDFRWEKLRGWGIAALAAAAAVIGVLGNKLPVTFLYQAGPFGSVQNGPQLRFLCYSLAGLLGFFLLTVTPDIRFPWTRGGADTMAAYLIHAPIVAVLREVNPNWALCPLYAAALIYIIYKILQWNCHLYGIVSEGRRDSPWPRSKKSTRNTPDLSIGSCCP